MQKKRQCHSERSHAAAFGKGVRSRGISQINGTRSLDAARDDEQRTERGNALWFILVGVIMLGALTMMLSRSGSSVDQSGDVEQLRIKMSQVLRYGKSLESGIQNLILQGASENTISFENSETTTDYTNARCTQDLCMLFESGGAGLSYQSPPSGVNDGSDWIFTAANNVGTSTRPVGTHGARSGNDLIMLLANANSSFCKQVVKDVGIDASGTTPVDTTGISTAAFTGTYNNALVEIDGDPSPFELEGANAGCFTDDNSGIRYFYYVILAR